MIPDEPNSIGLYKTFPWWSILHYLIQTAPVLMLELAYCVDQMPEKAENILNSAKKIIRWLHHMAADNAATQRA